ncbi:uncharacterized protein LOC122498316 [Leptopilina heterotoma]|uniref:uncharacterized protein LOC122498316 n=1 Tax=Leptopilina heterotoma TaxID=63436 RepID=UPI001CA9F5EB|nr:uncharacterized protein LOC122498316 [Leptopilina heterotoma]
MGNLPKARVTPGRLFHTSGVDNAGPIQIHVSWADEEYVLIYTVTTVPPFREHLGNSARCLMLLPNFTVKLRLLLLMTELWHFIPPNSPHCGGLWEAGVKATKHHLKRVIREHVVTFEELSTLLVEIEACLNLRPLCPLTNDSDDLSALTPAHFLIGYTLGVLPKEGILNIPENRLNRFQLLQRMRDNFWNRWSSEYLQHLQERGKWRGVSVNFSPDQLVVIKDDRYPPSKWALGRVLEVHPGKDGLVRVVTVKTSTTTLRRHKARLSPLFLPSSKPHSPTTETTNQ